MTSVRIFLLTTALLLATQLAGAQAAADLPGHFAVEALPILADGTIDVDIDLRGPMAKIVAAATAKQDPEFSAAMEKIQRIRVRVGTPAVREPAAIRSAIDRAASDLEHKGWYRMVSLREGEDTVYLLALEHGSIVQGLTALVHDGENEVVLVNIAGEMSPETIGALIGNIDQLESLRSGLAAGSPGR